VAGYLVILTANRKGGKKGNIVLARGRGRGKVRVSKGVEAPGSMLSNKGAELIVKIV